MTTPATLAALAAAIDAQYLSLSIEALGVGTTPERRRELQARVAELLRAEHAARVLLEIALVA